jgi:hypothetical protein
VCRSKARRTKPLTKPPQRTHQLVVDKSQPLAEGETSDDETYTLFQTTRRKSKPYITTFTVHRAKLPMEIDTGASLSLISEATYRKTWNTADIPCTYTGDYLEVLGSIEVRCGVQ